MNDEVYNKLKGEADKTVNGLIDYANECQNNANILSTNTNKVKVWEALIASVTAFFVILFSVSDNYMGVSLNDFSLTALLSMNTVVSLGLGYGFQALLSISSKKVIKEKFNLSKEKDILYEKYKNEIEELKTDNKIEVLNRINSSFQRKYEIRKKEYICRDGNERLTISELEEKKDKLEQLYKNSMSQLEILTLQQFLCKEFEIYRTKGNRFNNIMDKSLYFFPLSLIIGGPLIFEFFDPSELFTIKFYAMGFSPTVIGFGLSVPFLHKNNQKYLKIFNRLNSELGVDALKEIPDKEYENALKYPIIYTMEEAVGLGIDLREVTYALECKKLEIGRGDNKEVFRNLERSLADNQEMKINPSIIEVENKDVLTKRRVLEKNHNL